MKYNVFARRFIYVGIAATFFWFAADEGEAAEFSINHSGAIVADQQSFTSLEEYVGSDYFRQNGKRCGT